MKKIAFSLFFILLVYVGLGQHQLYERNVVLSKATPFDLCDVRLSEGTPFYNAMQKNGEWLMALDPDRMYHRFLVNAGLTPKAPVYGGWESEDLSGQTGGHYLSALALMYAASSETKYKERLDYSVSELARCQVARKTGILGATPNDAVLWDEISRGDVRSSGFDLNGHWVPWYSLHKVWKGLTDAYVYAGNEQAKEVVVKLSDWAIDMLAGLDEQKMQQMLACEFGGMNEAFADVYAITGDRRYLEMARRFHHKAILDPLADQKDELRGNHANTQVPKIIGASRLYELTGDRADSTIASFFWKTVVDSHSYVNGGNSDHEHFGEPCKLNDRLSSNSSETCNTYNMLRLTRELFSWNPSAKLMDFYERALYNHILASQNPEDGMVCYYTPLNAGGQRTYSSPFDSFWCCVGTGIENHTKYAESIYYKDSHGGLFVNLFIPSTLDWRERNTKVSIHTKYPEQSSIEIKIDGKGGKFPLHIRYPQWAKSVSISVNGKPLEVSTSFGSYIDIDRRWRGGDRVRVEFPMEIRAESMPDNPNRIGIFYGPTLLAAKMGVQPIDLLETPVMVVDKSSLPSFIRPVEGNPLHFVMNESVFPENTTLNFLPFNQIHDQHYIVYFDLFSMNQWKVREAEYLESQKRRKEFEMLTVDVVRVGEMQPERDHNLKSERSGAGEVGQQKFRHAMDGGWFSFDVAVMPNSPQRMMCSYWGTDRDNRNFDILIDDVLFVEESLKGEHGNQTFDKFYDIPAQMIQGKNSIRVKFQARPGNFAGGLFGFRILK